MLQAIQDNVGRLPEQALADTGYNSEVVFEAPADSDCDLGAGPRAGSGR